MIKQGKFNWKSDGTTSVDASSPTHFHTDVARRVGESDADFKVRVLAHYAAQAPNVQDLLTVNVNEIRVMSSLKSLSEIDDFPAPNLSGPTRTRRRGASDL